MENNTRISESHYSRLERLPERAETDSFNIVTQKSVKHYGTSSVETASKLPTSWEEITKAKAAEVEATEVEAEVEVDQVHKETLTQNRWK